MKKQMQKGTILLLLLADDSSSSPAANLKIKEQREDVCQDMNRVNKGVSGERPLQKFIHPK